MHPLLFPFHVFLRTVPDAVHTEILARLFTHLLKGQALAEQLDELQGKRLCLGIRDTGNEFVFVIRNQGLARVTQATPSPAWDVRIRGGIVDFWLLLTRQEDPDTLFFHRRLTIEGDTATGLHMKNLLDAMDYDWESHVQAVCGPHLGGKLCSAVRRLGVDRRVHRVLSLAR